MSDWKNILLKNNVPIIEPKIKPVKKVIPIESQKEVVNNTPLKEEKEVKVKFFGIKGQEIQKLRNEKKLTQKELANKLAMNISDLQHIESGKAVFNNGLYKRIMNILK
jgi:ribosome-binding protein aMBF1 (putative translation factor)